MHIHLGYTVIVAFFGLLCNNGQHAFCDKFISEIMCIGYGILASLLIIAGTSYFRHRKVFAIYTITVSHTVDVEQRRGRANRSQPSSGFLPLCK
jgi:hypothetical protein